MNDLSLSSSDIAAVTLSEKLYRMFRVFHLKLELEEARTVKFSTGVALRGLLGSVMCKYDPELLKAVLKPEEKGHTPSPLMLKLDSPCKVSQKLDFTLTLLDPTGTQSAKAIKLIRDRFPGEQFSGTRICKVAVGEPFIPPVFAPDSGEKDLFSIELDFFSPVRIKRHGVIVESNSFSLAFVVSALTERFNTFLKQYGIEETLESAQLVEKASLAFIRKRNIRYQTQQRRSGHTEDTIYLSGCTGELVLSHISCDLVRLLYLGTFTGAGRHTSAGSGMYRMKSERML